MQSKVFRSGASFGHTCQYVCQDLDRARILEIEGVRSHDLKLMAADFESQQQRHPSRNKAVFHSTLTFPPGENPPSGPADGPNSPENTWIVSVWAIRNMS